MNEVRGPLVARLWLTGVVFGQIILTPIVAFSITYLFSFDSSNEGFTISFEQQMIPWIITASLAYGMLALALSLIVGGFTPVSVVESGGWGSTLGISRSRKTPDKVTNSKLRHYHSPHGRMVRIVHDRLNQGHGLLSIHGGLVLLAIPFQLCLVIIPLMAMLLIPSDWIAPNRLLELSLLGYLVVLTAVMRIFPNYAKQFVAAAAFTRRWLISMTRLSWMAPVLVLWLLGRLASMFVVTWLVPDLAISIAAEKRIFEEWLGIGTVPENSFLDLLTALAVMPLAAFTTLAVLGGGSGQIPDWLKAETKSWENPNEESRIDEVSDVELEKGEEDTSILEEVIPFGAAAMLPGSIGVALGNKIDEIGSDETNGEIKEPQDDDESGTFPSLI